MRFCLGCGAALSPATPAQAPLTYTPKHPAGRNLKGTARRPGLFCWSSGRKWGRRR